MLSGVSAIEPPMWSCAFRCQVLMAVHRSLALVTPATEQESVNGTAGPAVKSARTGHLAPAGFGGGRGIGMGKKVGVVLGFGLQGGTGAGGEVAAGQGGLVRAGSSGWRTS